MVLVGPGPSPVAAQETLAVGPPTAVDEVRTARWTEWQLGIEGTEKPAGLMRWEAHQAGWLLGAGASVGPGSRGVTARAAPHLRIGRVVGQAFYVAAGLGMEWSWDADAENRDESELFWEAGLGWRPGRRLRVDVGLRRIDYHTPRTLPFARVAVAVGGEPRAPRPPEPPSVFRATLRTAEMGREAPAMLGDAGIPPTPVHRGLVTVAPTVLDIRGAGARLGGVNPRGDPRPGQDPATVDNVDRLAVASDLWGTAGAWSGWARWRSHLHTDPSIAERTRRVMDGASFPVSISFSGGGRWDGSAERSLAAAGRLDPKALLWLPHLGEERTGRVTAARGSFDDGHRGLRLEAFRLTPLNGLTVDRLQHVHVRADLGEAEAVRLSLEGEWLTVIPRAPEPASRNPRTRRARFAAARPGPVSVRASVGDDVRARIGGSPTLGPVRSELWVAYRSEPGLLHYESLVGRGWMGPGGVEGSATLGPVWSYGLAASLGPWAVDAMAWEREPVWRTGTMIRTRGGYADVRWSHHVPGFDIESRARIRVGEWGPAEAWWREKPTATAFVGWRGEAGPATLTASLSARSALRSVRAALTHGAGVEAGLGIHGVLPEGGPLGGMRMSMVLDDVLDRRLPARIGAPERGRRLTVLLSWFRDAGPELRE